MPRKAVAAKPKVQPKLLSKLKAKVRSDPMSEYGQPVEKDDSRYGKDARDEKIQIEEGTGEPEGETEPPPEPEHHDPLTTVGLDASGSGTYAYTEIGEEAEAKNRSLLIDGVNYEHVATDADKCWLYRAME
jgi:hypothetical protein